MRYAVLLALAVAACAPLPPPLSPEQQAVQTCHRLGTPTAECVMRLIPTYAAAAEAERDRAMMAREARRNRGLLLYGLSRPRPRPSPFVTCNRFGTMVNCW